MGFFGEDKKRSTSERQKTSEACVEKGELSNQEAFRSDYSNHLTFKKIRVLSLIANLANFSFSIERLRMQEVLSLNYFFFGYK
jgi:hypothetical protein